MVRIAAAVLCVLLLAPAAAGAADSSTEARLREALRSATAQLRAAEDERARLQAAVVEARKEIAELQAKLAAAGGATRTARAERGLADVTRRNTELTESVTRLEGDLAACRASSKESGDAARVHEEERSKLQEQLGPLNDRVSDCEAKNAKMHEVAKELLRRYERMSLGEALRAKEPFLGLKRVELENLAQSYEDRLLDQQVQPGHAARSPRGE